MSKRKALWAAAGVVVKLEQGGPLGSMYNVTKHGQNVSGHGGTHAKKRAHEAADRAAGLTK